MSLGGSKQKLGHKYHIGMHMVLCYGPCDAIKNIRIGDREAWNGTAVDNDTINVLKPSLFGGEKREGGVKGDIDVHMGAATQTPNVYLQQQIQNNIPAFRGVVSMVFNTFYFGNNPYIKTISTLIKRTDIQTNGVAQWQPSLANINDGMNPAHIIRECLTNDFWGMGYGESQMDETSFQAAAQALFDEGFGLNMLWSNAEPIDQFIQNVEKHINGSVSQDPVTSLWRIKLIRNDYVVASLPLFDENNVVSLESFSRKAWGETVNEISVVYRDNSPSNGQKDKTVTVQDIANVQVQGVRIGRTVNLQGIAQEDLATRVAFREVRVAAAPLSKITIITNRDASSFILGDVFKFSWADLGVIEGVYRIVDIDFGNIRNHQIKIEAVEDVFSLEAATYISPQPSGWIDPRSAPVAAVNQQAVEATYWEIIQNISLADINNFDPDAGFAIAHASPPSGDSYDFDLWTRVGTAAFVQQRPGDFCPYATLRLAGGKTDTVLDYENDIRVDTVPLNIYAYLDTEIIEIVSIDLVNKQVTVNRAILDTVPQTHAIGGKLWFVGNFGIGADLTERVASQVVDMKILPSTGQGTLDIASATAVQVTMNNRFQRPYPSSAPSINAILLEDIATGQQVYAWKHRDKTMQTVTFTKQTDADIGPEVGVTYDLELYDENDVLRNSQLGISANTYTWLLADEKAASGLIEADNKPNGDYEAIVNADGPEAYYRLGETSGTTVFDETVNSHDLQLFGNFTLDVAGALDNDTNGAIDFNGGRADLITAAAGFDSGAAGDWTVECWVNFTGTANQNILAVREGTPVTLILQTLSGTIRGEGHHLNNWIQAPGTFNDGNWHHVAFTYDGTADECELWVNGVSVGTQDQSGTTKGTGNQRFWIASNLATAVYQHSIDEVAWYLKKLTAAEIAEHHSIGVNVGFRVNDQIRVTLKSKNASFDSFQTHDHTYERSGWGLRWDQYWDNKP